jgi:starch-binding outer membrane protein, SusD/RagB family
MINADSNAYCDYLLLDLSSDADSFLSTMLTNPNLYISNAYQWKKKIWDDGQSDDMYNTAYNRILQMNVVLDKIGGATLDNNSSEDDRSIVKSQALINRAFYYWQLANIYGPAYQESTASQDLSVPLITTSNANLLPKQAVAKEIYNFITTDLLSAVNNPVLPGLGVDIIHPGKAAGFALLARTYLYMSKFDSAMIYADSALAFKSSLVDYNSYIIPSQLISLNANPEIYLARICINSYFYALMKSSFYSSNDYNNLFTSSDQRLDLFFPFTPRFGYAPYVMTNSDELVFDYSISVPEMLLTKAECLSRKGNYDEAISLVNTLREKRMPSYAYAPIVDYTSENTDSIVIAERRKELSFHGGLRWFDLKRLNKETKFAKTLYRYAYDSAYNVVTLATLQPNSPNYVMPFSPLIIDNNPNMIQNIRE